MCRVLILHWCSLPCRETYKSRVKNEQLNIRKRNCLVCGKTFTPRRTQLRMKQGKYCSIQCRSIGNIGSKASTETLVKLRLAQKLIAGRNIRRGPLNKRWTGGRKAAVERRIKSGKAKLLLRKYRAANSHKVREWDQRRSGRKTGRLPKGTVAKLYQLQGGRCAACKKLLHGKYHVDHVVALANSGKHEARNIQLLCPHCNVRKSAKDQAPFMRELGYLL